MSSPSSPIKPLNFGSQRASPFRRPESPLARSPSTVRAATPSGSPLKTSTTPNPELSRSQSSNKPFSPPAHDSTPWLTTRGTSRTAASPPSSPTRSPLSKSPLPFSSSTNSIALGANSQRGTPASTTADTGRPPRSTSTAPHPASTPSFAKATPSTDPLSSLPPHHLHTLRESFAVLDRHNTGAITAADVSQQLLELGLDASPAALSAFFPAGGPSSMNLAGYLQALAADLGAVSRSDELLDAFAAFDKDDEGVVDAAELREALVRTLPENGQRGLNEDEVQRVLAGFTGRQGFRKGMASGQALGAKKEVFRYGEFVAGIWGGADGEGQKTQT